VIINLGNTIPDTLSVTMPFSLGSLRVQTVADPYKNNVKVKTKNYKEENWLEKDIGNYLQWKKLAF